VYPFSTANEKKDFSSADNVIQWLANEAKKYGEWPSMDEDKVSEKRNESDKIASNEVFKAMPMAENHVAPYQSGDVENLSFEDYKEVLNSLTEFINESKENEAKAMYQYFETEANHPKILNLFKKIIKKIIFEKKSFVVKPGDGAVGLGVMMCHYKSTQKRWKITYPYLSTYDSKTASVYQDFVLKGEHLNQTSDDIIHALFYYVLPVITSTINKTWIIEELVPTEIMAYGTEVPFEIKIAVNYGKVVAIASKGYMDRGGHCFIWRRDGEVVFFNDEDVEDKAEKYYINKHLHRQEFLCM
jgi:hypothetical protein